MTEIFHNPRCSKSRETLQLLEAQGIQPETTLYLKTPPTKTRLKEILKMLGIRQKNIWKTRENAGKRGKLLA